MDAMKGKYESRAKGEKDEVLFISVPRKSAPARGGSTCRQGAGEGAGGLQNIYHKMNALHSV